MKLYEAAGPNVAVIVHEETGEIMYEVVGAGAYEACKAAAQDPRWLSPYQSDALKDVLEASNGALKLSYTVYPCPFVADELKAANYICQLAREAELALAPQVRFAS